MPDDHVPNRPAVPSGAGAVGPSSELELEDALAVDVQGLEEVGLGQAKLAWRRFRRHKLAMIGAVALIVIAFFTVVPGVLTKYGYAQQNLSLGAVGPRLSGGFRGWHPFGTDRLGRDQLARILYGGRVSLAVGMGVAIFSGLIGAVMGAMAGYFGGKLDNFLMRTTDLFLAIPLLVILIILQQVFGGSIPSIVLVLSLFFWMPVARIVRGVFLSLKEKEFVEAAQASGASSWRIIMRHLFPNSMGPIIVNMTLSIAAAILTESTLSFLGFGITPPSATWGSLLSDAQIYTQIYPWLVWFPGIMILITVLAVNFLGDGLRDALDPTQQRVRA